MVVDQTFYDLIPLPETFDSCRVVERVSRREENVVLCVSHCEVSAVLLLQPWVHALFCRGGSEVEGDGEQEETEVEEVEGRHQQKLPLVPHCFTSTPCNNPHISQLVLHRWVWLRSASVHLHVL